MCLNVFIKLHLEVGERRGFCIFGSHQRWLWTKHIATQFLKLWS